eukprot:COSAG01_NODE_6615_length_3576_cov_9.088007_1_plen_65_part_00
MQMSVGGSAACMLLLCARCALIDTSSNYLEQYSTPERCRLLAVSCTVNATEQAPRASGEHFQLQ